MLLGKDVWFVWTARAGATGWKYLETIAPEGIQYKGCEKTVYFSRNRRLVVAGTGFEPATSGL